MSDQIDPQSRERELSALELAVLEMCLAGPDPRLRLLSDQLKGCRVRSRQFTGKGFLAELEVQRDASRAPLDVRAGRISDVVATIDGLEHGAGFVLYITNGELDALEGYAYDESWPENIRGFDLSYASGASRDLRGLAPS